MDALPGFAHLYACYLHYRSKVRLAFGNSNGLDCTNVCSAAHVVSEEYLVGRLCYMWSVKLGFKRQLLKLYSEGLVRAQWSGLWCTLRHIPSASV